MRTKYFIFLLILAACNKPAKKDGFLIAKQFIDQHSDSFIQNTNLSKYDYNPRRQFFYHSDTSQFLMAYVRDNTEVIIRTESGLGIIIDEFGLNLDLPKLLDIRTASLTNFPDTIKLIVNDSLPIKIISYEKNPADYFIKLKSDINQYEIVTLRHLKIGGIIEVYLTSTDFLLYFPDNPNIKEVKFQEFWDERIKSGKKLKSNWYYYKSERPLDFG